MREFHGLLPAGSDKGAPERCPPGGALLVGAVALAASAAAPADARAEGDFNPRRHHRRLEGWEEVHREVGAAHLPRRPCNPVTLAVLLPPQHDITGWEYMQRKHEWQRKAGRREGLGRRRRTGRGAVPGVTGPYALATEHPHPSARAGFFSWTLPSYRGKGGGPWPPGRWVDGERKTRVPGPPACPQARQQQQQQAAAPPPPALEVPVVVTETAEAIKKGAKKLQRQAARAVQGGEGASVVSIKSTYREAKDLEYRRKAQHT